MTTRSSEEIEMEVEATRGDLDRTVEALKEKMTPGQFIDELSNSLKGTGAADMFSNLGAQVRDNPMPLLLIGAGMAWMMMGKGGGQRRFDAGYMESDGVGYGASAYRPSDFGSGAERRSFADGEAGGPGLKEKVSDIASHASEAAHRAAAAAAGVKHRVTGAAGQARQSAEALRGQAARAGQTVQRTFLDTMEQEPLIVGALGLAVGAAIGAALPSTSVENRTLGRARDKLVETGKAKAQEVVEGAKDAAEAAYQTVREEAEHQGLTGQPEGGSLVDKAQNVVRAGVEAAKDKMSEGRTH